MIKYTIFYYMCFCHRNVAEFLFRLFLHFENGSYLFLYMNKHSTFTATVTYEIHICLPVTLLSFAVGATLLSASLTSSSILFCVCAAHSLKSPNKNP